MKTEDLQYTFYDKANRFLLLIISFTTAGLLFIPDEFVIARGMLLVIFVICIMSMIIFIMFENKYRQMIYRYEDYSNVAYSSIIRILDYRKLLKPDHYFIIVKDDDRLFGFDESKFSQIFYEFSKLGIEIKKIYKHNSFKIIIVEDETTINLIRLMCNEIFDHYAVDAKLGSEFKK